MLKPESILEIPAETKTIARKAFPKGNTYIKLRDELGPIFDDEIFYVNTGGCEKSGRRIKV